MLERYLTNSDFFSFLDQINDLIGSYNSRNGSLGHILSSLGFPELIRKIESRIELLEKSSSKE